MDPVRRLSPAAKAEIKALSGPRPREFLIVAATTWATIAATVAAAIMLHNFWFSLFAIIFIATRQNLLALLVHEQTHYLGFRGRHGDWIANLLAAYPLIAVSIEGYSKEHLRHHRFYFTQADPDFHRKNGPDWVFPMPPWKLALLFLRDVTGFSFLQYMATKKKFPNDGAFDRRNPSPMWLRPLFYLTVAAVLTLVGGWGYFLLYWMLPLLTVFAALVRWGALCEHSYGVEGVSVEESSPMIIPTLANRILLPNLNFAMHPYHHYFAGVSWSKLPALHAVFEREGLVHAPMVFHGQGAYLKYLLTRRDDGAAQAPEPVVIEKAAA